MPRANIDAGPRRLEVGLQRCRASERGSLFAFSAMFEIYRDDRICWQTIHRADQEDHDPQEKRGDPTEKDLRGKLHVQHSQKCNHQECADKLLQQRPEVSSSHRSSLVLGSPGGLATKPHPTAARGLVLDQPAAEYRSSPDSPLEGTGFELPVPREIRFRFRGERARDRWRKRSLILRTGYKATCG
jgi:hypothetical protein